MSCPGCTVLGMTHAPHPGWHGIPPSEDRFVAPASSKAPMSGITRPPEKAPAIWVDLEYPCGLVQTVKGFAMAWTSELVEVQWVEFSRARDAWVPAAVVRRRQLEDRHRHRDG